MRVIKEIEELNALIKSGKRFIDNLFIDGIDFDLTLSQEKISLRNCIIKNSRFKMSNSIYLSGTVKLQNCIIDSILSDTPILITGMVHESNPSLFLSNCSVLNRYLDLERISLIFVENLRKDCTLKYMSHYDVKSKVLVSNNGGSMILEGKSSVFDTNINNSGMDNIHVEYAIISGIEFNRIRNAIEKNTVFMFYECKFMYHVIDGFEFNNFNAAHSIFSNCVIKNCDLSKANFSNTVVFYDCKFNNNELGNYKFDGRFSEKSYNEGIGKVVFVK